MSEQLKLTYIGGPTALLEFGGVRLLTDPTFDAAPRAYSPGPYTLRKTMSPAIDADAVEEVDAVLLSHDHHFDNLDEAGRAFLKRAGKVFTTAAGAQRLGGNAVALAPYETATVTNARGDAITITATPARHGPVNGDRGPVIGFVLSSGNSAGGDVYVSGDTVWYEGVAEVARKFPVQVAILFMGAARVAEVGPAHLTMTGEEGVEAARAFGESIIIPLHYEGWEYFSEGREVIAAAFEKAGMGNRLRWLEAGKEMAIAAG